MSIPTLPQAEELAGRWLVENSGDRRACSLELTAKRQGNGHRAVADPACLAKLNLRDAEIWRPAPDGIALARSDGRTVAFFSKRNGCYLLRRPDQPDLNLRRDPDSATP